MKKLFVTTQTLCKRVWKPLAFRRKLLISAGLFGFLQMSGYAADVTVTSTADSGSGSLRQAIVDVSVGGEIDFAPALAGQTIALASELTIGKNLTITAAGLSTGVTLNGGGTKRMIRIGASQTVTLRGLTFTNGNGTGAAQNGFGGAVFNSGTTLIDQCKFTGNTTANYGGGIHNDLNSTLTVDFSTFQGNSTGFYGGAISNFGVMNLNRSTIVANTAGFQGGGVYSDFSSTVTITNSTFTQNVANFFGGGIFNGSPRLTLTSSTLIANTAVSLGGGIYNDFLGTPSSNLNHVIVALNTAPGSANIFGPWAGGNNFTSGDPKLSPLGNFGGPTQTMPPLPNSPVIDVGGTTSLSTDQRGQARILNGGIDIGAFEIPFSDYNPAGVTIYARVPVLEQPGNFEISTDPEFLPVVSTFAGTGNAGFLDGTRLGAELGYPSGVAQDSLGNIIFADSGNHRIRMIGPDGVVVTIAGTGVYGLANGSGLSAQFAFPSALAVGPDDSVYVSDTYNHRICKLTRPAIPGGAWTVTNLAGTGINGFSDGAGSVARFFLPYGLSVDAVGNVFVADSMNHRIRRITPAGAVSTYAGSGVAGAANSTMATAAEFDTPQSVVVVGGNLFVADTFNDVIRKVVISSDSAARVVTTFAGSTRGYNDGNGNVAQFDTPSGLATDGAGSLYVADEQNHQIRKITATADVSTVAGTGVLGMVNGKSDVARFNAPTGVMVGLDGNLVVADAQNHLLRRILIKPITVPATAIAGTTNADGGQVKTVLDVFALGLDPSLTYYFRWKSPTTGNTQLLGQSFFLYDFPRVVTEPATDVTPSTAQLNGIVDPKNGRTEITFEYSTDPTLLNPYEVTTVAGSGLAGFEDASGTAAQFSNPSGVVTASNGDIFLADRLNHRIRKITSAGVVSTFAGSGIPGFTDASGIAAKFERPTGLAIDSSGNLYVADEASHRIRRITPAGQVSTFAGSGIAGFAEGAAADARFLYPAGVAVDSAGNVYVSDSGNHRIRKIDATTGLVSTFAGNGVAGFNNGELPNAQFSNPQGIAMGSGNAVLVADTGNHRIRAIEAGSVITLAGDGTEGFLNGSNSLARFNSPTGISRDGVGVVYVADSGNHRIRQIGTDGQVSTLAGSGIAGQLNTPTVALHPATASRFDTPVGITADAAGGLLVTQEGMLRKISRSATLPTVILPDATGNGDRPIFAAVNRPLLYSSTYYFRARGVGYRDTVTGEILSFVTPQARMEVFNGSTTSSPLLEDEQATAINFGSTPTGQPTVRAFTIFNPGTWPLTVSAIEIPNGYQLSGGVGVVNPLTSATFQLTLAATQAGIFSGNIVLTSDAPEQPVFTFPVTGEVLDPPVVTTLGVTGFASGLATFNATVNPRDSSTTVWFEWSPDLEFDGVGVGAFAGSTQGFTDGLAAVAQFNQPSAMAVDAAGNIYVADQANHCIRKIEPDGTTSTFAGTGIAGDADGEGNVAQFNGPVGIVINSTGVLFVTDSGNHRIRAIDTAGAVTTYSGLGSPGFTDGIPTAARFINPAGMAIDPAGNLYIADSGNHRIRKVALDGSVSTLAGTGAAGSGNGANPQFNSPLGIARDTAGYLYVTEASSHTIRKVAANGFTSIFAGSPTIASFTNAVGTAARFSSPTGLAVGINGLVYVADRGNNRIRTIDSGGVVKTLAGTGVSGMANGSGELAQFSNPFSIMTTSSGNIFVGESGNSIIRKITPVQVLLPAVTGLTGTTDVAVELAATNLPLTTPYYYRAIATNSGGTTVGNIVIVGGSSLPPLTGFELWQTSKFGNDAGNSLIAGPLATPANDGVSNLLKYAFGLEPFAAPPAGGMPVVGLSGGNLTVTYNKALTATDVNYTVEWSSGMGTWSSVGVNESIESTGLTTQRVIAWVPAAPAPAKFIRVTVTLP